MNDIINQFFRNLSNRMYKENDLSDITYSLINSSEKLKGIFISFVTNKKRQNVNYDVTREYSLDEKNRPDFFFVSNDDVILLENKIWDMDYHFEDYKEALSIHMSSNFQYQSIPPLKALISAHRLSKHTLQLAMDYGFEISYWYNFVKLLKQEITRATFNADECELVKGYVKYLEEVIKVPEIGKIQFTSETLKSITYLIELMKYIVKQYDSKDYEYSLDTINKKSNTERSTGVGYIIKSKINNEYACVSFYLQYEYKGSSAILIELPLGWNKDINSRITKTIGLTYDFEGQNLKYKDGCAFIMKQSLFEEFLKSDKEKQEQTILSFFKEVNDVIEKYI